MKPLNPKFAVGERVLTKSKVFPQYSDQIGEVTETRRGKVWLYRVSGTEYPYRYWLETALRKLPDQQGQSWTELMAGLKKPSEVRA